MPALVPLGPGHVDFDSNGTAHYSIEIILAPAELSEEGLTIATLESEVAHELGHAKMQHLEFDLREDTPQPEREFEADRVAASIVGTDVVVAGLREAENWWAERNVPINIGSGGRPTTKQRIERLLHNRVD